MFPSFRLHFIELSGSINLWRFCVPVVFAMACNGWPISAQETTIESQQKTTDPLWQEIRDRVFPLPFICDRAGHQKVNLERLLVELLDESVFPSNPLQVDDDQRRELARLLRMRHQDLESRGVNLKAIVQESEKRGYLIEWERLAPGVDYYEEHCETVRRLVQLLRPPQVSTWRDMAIGLVHFHGDGYCSLVQRVAQRVPEVWEDIGKINGVELFTMTVEEDFLLNKDFYFQMGRSFDRALSRLPQAERDKLDRHMKVDVFK